MELEKNVQKKNDEALRIGDVMRSSFKLDFSKLIGRYYDEETKMIALNWMLKTGKPFRQAMDRWNVIGVSQRLFGYSANDHDIDFSLPFDISRWNLFFDAVFSRAIYQLPNKAVKEWREKENIYPEKYRMLKSNREIFTPKTHPHLSWLISDIFDFNGKILKKEFAHPDYEDRTKPKIISISIFTIGTGWIVRCQFSFSEFDYEPGWEKSYRQKENQSLWDFFGYVYNELQLSLLADA